MPNVSPVFDSVSPRTGARDASARLIVTLALSLALSLAGRPAAAAAYKPPLAITVEPAIVAAGSGGNTLTFTLTARKRAGGSVVVVVPTAQSGSPWTVPQSSDAARPGFVSVQKDTCAKASLAALTPASDAGTWAIVVNFRCGKSKAFSIVYGGGTGASKLTATSSIGTYEFATLTRKKRWRAKDTGPPDTAKSFTAVAVQPVVDVAAGLAASLQVTGQSETTSGSQQSITVTVRDAYGNTATDYGGTVHFTSSDGAATLPADATLTSGVGAFPMTLVTAGSHTVTATDVSNPALTGQLEITVTASNLFVHLTEAAKAWVPLTAVVEARDDTGNLAPGYDGTVHFASSDDAATLPADATLAGGQGVFPVTFRTAAALHTLTVTDTARPTLTAETSFDVSGPQAKGVETTFLNPKFSQIAVSTVGVLGNDSIPAPDVTEILSVTQPLHTTANPHQVVQVGVITIDPGGRVIIWDLNPPDSVEPEDPNVPLVRCSVADGSGCDLPNPILFDYRISDGVNESLATEVLIIETPDYIDVQWDPDAGQHEIAPDGIRPLSLPLLLIPYLVQLPVTAVTDVDPTSGFATVTASGPVALLGMNGGNFSIPMTLALPPSASPLTPGYNVSLNPLALSVQPPLAVTDIRRSQFTSVQIIKPQVGHPDQIDAQWQGSLFNVGDSFCTGQCCARPGSSCKNHDDCCSQNCPRQTGQEWGQCACRTATCINE